MNELISLIYRNDAAAVRERLERGADVDDRDQQGRTLLMHAVLGAASSLEIVQLLLDHGADVDARDNEQGWTALHFAAQEKRIEVIDALLHAGAEVNPSDRFGNTPLGRAVFSARGDNSAVKALLDAGGDPDILNASGVSPRALAKSIANYDVASAFDSV
jgi:ankyrin repeat protein